MNSTGNAYPQQNQNYYNYNQNNDGHNDLEANLLQDNNIYRDRENQDDSNIAQNPGSLPADFRSNLAYSIKWNVILLLVSLGKIAASTTVLATSSFCFGPYQLWIIFMGMHDIVYSLMLITTIQLVRQVNGAMAALPENPEPASQENNNVPNENEQIIRLNNDGGNAEASQNNHQLFRPEVPPQRENNLDSRLASDNIEMVRLARDITQKQRKIAKLTAFTDLVYVILFFIGQMIFFLSSGLTCETPEIKDLTLAYLLLGYLWLLSPILLFCLACLCLPVLLFVLILFGGGRGSQVPANTAIINSLEVKRFANELPGSNECSICMVDYAEGDNIIQLKCSPMHHFHEDCIKKWLQINGLCPICRTRLQDMKDEQPVPDSPPK